MDVQVELLLLVAAIAVPTVTAMLPSGLSQPRRTALALVGLAGLALFWTPTLPHVVAYAVAAGGATAMLAQGKHARLAHLAAALGATLAIMVAALAWVSTLA
jgi:hypothetical protein